VASNTFTGTRPVAPAARRPFPLVTGSARVVAVRSLTPLLVRITLVAEAFRGLPVEEPGEIITLLWPEEGSELVLPEEGWRFPPGVAERQHARNYTVRRWEAGSEEMDIDFVLHGDHGRASRWAGAAEPGDAIGFAASRMHWVSDVDADWALLVADETGLPALAAIAETLDPGFRAHALVEVDDRDGELRIDSPADLEVGWVHRRGAPPGTTSLLADAVRLLDLPSGPGRAWGGGEALAMRDIRRHLRGERGMSSASTHLLGYWKHEKTDDWE